MTTTLEQTSEIHLPTGIRMRYVEQGPTDARDVTVLLHGWPDSSYSFSRRQHRWGADGCRGQGL